MRCNDNQLPPVISISLLRTGTNVTNAAEAGRNTDSSFYLDSNASNSNEAVFSQTAVCARQAHGGA